MELTPELKKTCKNIIEYYNNDSSFLLQILLKIQRQVSGNYIDSSLSEFIAKEMGISPTNISEVMTYFDALNIEKRGEYSFGVCSATACTLNDSKNIVNILMKELGISLGQTTKDGLITLKTVPCFGACDIAPAIRINDDVFGNLDETKVKALIAKVREDM